MIFLVQINLLINEDLLFHSKLKNCELFHENCRVMQYFNYYEYEHIIRICQKEKKCDMCAAFNHDNQTCSFWNVSARHRCINCNQNHSAWVIKYNKRKKHVKKIQLVYISYFRQYKIDDHDQYVLIENQKQREQFEQSITSN